MSHESQLKELLGYYQSPAAQDCPHTPANQAALQWALAELQSLRGQLVDAAALRQAFQGAMNALERKPKYALDKELSKDLDKMSARDLHSLMMTWVGIWESLYNAMRDTQAGVKLLGELARAREGN